MRERSLTRWRHAAIGAVTAVALAAVSSGAGVAPGSPLREDTRIPIERSAAEPTLAEGVAVAAGQRFLDDYVEDDGRVVRPDDGGDTVSEGQAYAMLVAVAIDDRERFHRVWDWTRTQLQRDDGLLAWRWADGEVVDPMPATDADLDVAHALTLAADAFADPDLDRAAARIARGVLEHETVEGRLGPVAVAGPWASGRDDGEPWVNPSYGAPLAFDALAGLTGDPTWSALADGARRVVADVTVESDLPPDWAVLQPEAIVPRPAPGRDGDPVHGYDAVRTAVRFAVDCDAGGRALAAAMDDEYERATRADGGPAAVLHLDGEPAVDHGHPASSVAAAAASMAAGDAEDAARLLTVAEQQLDADATYYGAAWIALGRLWLTTDRLGGCAGD